MFVSRKEHDQLASRFPWFMVYDWPKLVKEWKIGGAIVNVEKSNPGLVHALKVNLSVVRN